jgi:hypothetical protein
MSSAKDPLSVWAAQFARLVARMVELVSPGRQAGFHVDRIVMRARRIVDLLNETSPHIAAAGEQAGLIATDLATGMATLSVGVFWSEHARAVITSDLGQLVPRTVLRLNRELTHALTQSPVDLPAVCTKAAALLGAAEDLRTRAYAFEDGRRTPAGGNDAQSGDVPKP